MAVTTVLALRALGLGGVLTAVPALRGLRRAWPDARLVLAGPAEPAELLRRTGVVDDVVPHVGLGPMRWGGPPPDVAVNLHGRGQQSHVLLKSLGARRMLAYRCLEPGADSASIWPTGPTWRAGEHAVARRWPAARWHEVALRLVDAGHHVVVTGTPPEAGLCEEVAAASRMVENRCGSDDLVSLMRLMGIASLVLCADTGVAHLATATRTPSVLLFGPAPPTRWGPRVDQERHRVLWKPAVGDPTGDPQGEHLDRRLARITPGDVLTAVRRLMPSAASTRLPRPERSLRV